MKLSKDRLKQIIKEELSSLLSEETDLEAEASAAFEDLVANDYKGLPEREMYIKNYIDLRTGDTPLRPDVAKREATFTRIDDPLEMSKALLPEDSPGEWKEYKSGFPGVGHKTIGRTVWFKHPDPETGEQALEAVLDHLTQGLMDEDPTREISEPRWDDEKNAWVATSTYWGSA